LKVDLFAPVINPLDTTILVVGRMVSKVVVVGESAVTVRPMMT
jgi:pyruvate/2-oxoglutarate dehydrogenase complex dihydrolipoamide acyltransferase (E2) component